MLARPSLPWFAVVLPLALASVACVADGKGSEAADGTGDGDGDSGDGDGDAQDLRPNWHQDIAPIVHQRCMQCHREDGVGPMALTDHAAAAPWAGVMLDEIDNGTMPPWGAKDTNRCTPEHDFKDDPSLSTEEIALFSAWLANGTPEGDPADAVDLPELPSTDLVGVSGTFTNGSDFTVDGPNDDYVCFSVDLGLSQTKYLDGVQMLPDNDQVVHHVLVWITDVAPAQHPNPYPCFATPAGGIPLNQAKLVAIWVPGSPATQFPEGVTVEVPAGSHVVLAYHYHPPGPGTYVDRSSVALRWRDEPTPWQGQFMFLGVNPSAPQLITAPFMIPAGAVNHPETVGEPWPGQEVSLFSVASHMHYVGRDQLIAIQRAGQTPQESQCMLHTPAWDFNWQRFYELDMPLEQLPTLASGDTVWMDCRYDNTMDNPGVAQALAEQGLTEPKNVYWGEGTLDEMCVALLGVAWPR